MSWSYTYDSPALKYLRGTIDGPRKNYRKGGEVRKGYDMGGAVAPVSNQPADPIDHTAENVANGLDMGTAIGLMTYNQYQAKKQADAEAAAGQDYRAQKLAAMRGSAPRAGAAGVDAGVQTESPAFYPGQDMNTARPAEQKLNAGMLNQLPSSAPIKAPKRSNISGSSVASGAEPIPASQSFGSPPAQRKPFNSAQGTQYERQVSRVGRDLEFLKKGGSVKRRTIKIKCPHQS